MAKKPRKQRDLMALWQGKVRKVFEQCSGPEVDVLQKLLWHPRMTSEQKYLIFDRAIFDVSSEREADREEEVRARRVRAREQRRQNLVRPEDRMHPSDGSEILPYESPMHGSPSSRPDIEHDSASPEK